MSYQKLEEEIRNYSNIFNAGASTISKISNYYKEIGKAGVKFAERMKKLLDDINSDLSKEDSTTTYYKLLHNFYVEKNNILGKIKAYFTALDKTQGEKISNFERDYKVQINEIINKLKNINTNIKQEKSQVDKWKNQYLDLCKSISETNKKLKTLGEETGGQAKTSADAQNIEKLRVQNNKNKDIKELKKKNYEEERIKLNKILVANEPIYMTILDNIEKSYYTKIESVKNFLNEINLSTSNFFNEYISSLKNVETYIGQINSKKDARLLKYNSYILDKDKNVQKRFVLEEFINFDSVINAEGEGDIKDQQEKDYNKANIILNLGNIKFEESETIDEVAKSLNTIIGKLLKNDSKIEDKDFIEVISLIENNGTNCNTFMEYLVVNFSRNEYFFIKNEENFQYLSKILNIILKFCFDKKEYFYICYMVMFAAEKCIFFKNDGLKKLKSINDLLTEQKLFNSNNFWTYLINSKIDMLSLVESKKEVQKRKKNLNTNTNTNKSKFSANNFMNVFGKLFNKGKEENQNLEDSILQKQIIKEKSGQYFITIFYEYLKKFPTFNYLKGEEILNNYAQKYTIDQNVLDYFKIVIKNDNYYKNEIFHKLQMNCKPKKIYETSEEKALKCIKFSLKFLGKDEYSNLLCLNKKYRKHILKSLFKNVLLNQEPNKELDIKKHIDIWKILLDYNQIKKDHDYSKVKELVQKSEKDIPCNDVIKLDAKRTLYNQNEEVEKKMINILLGISKEFPNVTYYQGMNQVASFLLSINKDNEEEAFYLFACLVKNTDYTKIFNNNLDSINDMFYQLDRIICLYLPEMYLYLKNNGIYSGYYVTAWLITLLTNAFNFTEEKNNSNIIMYIWDQFILRGWKSIDKLILVILHYNEKYIFENYSEGLLAFLTTNILCTQTFNKDNLEELKGLFKNIKFSIPNKLYHDLIKEFEMKKSLAILGPNTNSY